MLAAVSGAWSEASALCLASVQDNTNQPVVAVGGQITYTGYPCEPDEDCPECLTAALVTDDDKTYYLSGLSAEWEHRLDSIISHPTNAMEYNWPLKAVVSGTTYKQGSFDYIAVGDIRLLLHEEIMLLGKWQIYKETVTNGDGFDGVFTREGQGLHNRYYEFSYSQMYREIYGDYNKRDTFEYTLQPQADGTLLLTVAGLFDMTRQEYPWESGFSPITIHALSFSEIECEWQSYGGDEGPVIYHQHLNRYGSQADPLPSLCDKWNILGDAFWDGNSHFNTFTQQLTTDTLINSKRYVRLEQNGGYLGALREDDYARIYCIPAGTTHEYLLYAFNANPGDTFDNVWFGGSANDFPNGCKATVTAIDEANGRKLIKLDVEYKLPLMNETAHWEHYSWIDGIGLPHGPVGDGCPFDCNSDYGQSVLCAYMDGEQVYASDASKKYGCYYDSNEQQADTVKMYVTDGPGSSTVDPVDPNQIVVIVKDGQLVIREYLDVDLTFTLERIGALHAPARNDATQSDTFHESVAIPLTESGVYQLTLTHPDWGYSIVGTFEYTITGMPATVAQTAAQKIIRDGRLLIRHGGRTFTLTGVEVK